MNQTQPFTSMILPHMVLPSRSWQNQRWQNHVFGQRASVQTASWFIACFAAMKLGVAVMVAMSGLAADAADLTPLTELEPVLVVTDAGDGGTADHGNWAEAVLLGKPRPAAALPVPRPTKFRVRAPGLEIELSEEGEIVGVTLGSAGLRRALRGSTALAHGTNAGGAAARELTGGGVEFTRQIVHAPSGQRAALTERFLPAKDSVRWEIEIRGAAEPWSTGIETRLHWPVSNSTRFWTAWEDPEQKRDVWRDPLVLRPLVNKRLWYGAARWDEELSGPGYQPNRGDGFVIPLLTLAEPEQGGALSLVLSPEDPLLELTLTVRQDGAFVFSRNDHRLSQTNTVRFAHGLGRARSRLARRAAVDDAALRGVLPSAKPARSRHRRPGCLLGLGRRPRRGEAEADGFLRELESELRLSLHGHVSAADSR